MRTLEEKIENLERRLAALPGFDYDEYTGDRPSDTVIEQARKFMAEFYQAGGPDLIMVPFDGKLLAESIDYWLEIEFSESSPPVVWLGEEEFPWNSTPTTLAIQVCELIKNNRLRTQ